MNSFAHLSAIEKLPSSFLEIGKLFEGEVEWGSECHDRYHFQQGT